MFAPRLYRVDGAKKDGSYSFNMKLRQRRTAVTTDTSGLRAAFGTFVPHLVGVIDDNYQTPPVLQGRIGLQWAGAMHYCIATVGRNAIAGWITIKLEVKVGNHETGTTVTTDILRRVDEQIRQHFKDANRTVDDDVKIENGTVTIKVRAKGWRPIGTRS